VKRKTAAIIAARGDRCDGGGRCPVRLPEVQASRQAESARRLAWREYRGAKGKVAG
jgi:hypothetical protein